MCWKRWSRTIRIGPALPAGTPVYLRRLLERTLAKDRKQRLQAIGEARIALENSRTDEPPTVLVLSTSRSRLRWLWPCVAALFLSHDFRRVLHPLPRNASADPVLHLSVLACRGTHLRPSWRCRRMDGVWPYRSPPKAKRDSGFARWICPSFSFCRVLKTPEPLLVARRQVHRVLRGRKAQDHTRIRWASAGAVRWNGGRRRRNLEPRWSDTVQHNRRRRSPPARQCVRRRLYRVTNRKEAAAIVSLSFFPDGKHFVYVVTAGRGSQARSLCGLARSIIPPPAG